MRTLLLLAIASPCLAAITNIQATDSTSREVVLRYVAPTPSACTIEVSESSTYAPLVNDVNSLLYPGSNSDFRNGTQGRERAFVIGSAGTAIKYAPIDTTGFRSSRALQTNTLHYFRLSCASDVATGTFRTSNIAPGDTFPGVTSPIDPAHIGDTAWPDFDWNDRTPRIDPVSGVLLTKFPYVNHFRHPGVGYVAMNRAYDASGNWVNKNNALVEDGAVATFTGATNDPLILTSDTPNPQNYGRATGLTLRMKMFVDNASTTLSGCWTVNGVSCYGPFIPLTAPPVGALGAYTYSGDQDIWQTAVGSQTTVPMMAAWLSPHQTIPDFKARSGTADNTGPVVNQRNNGAFGPFVVAGTPITYNGVEYTVAAINNGMQITLSATPPADVSFATWTAHTIGFIVKKTSVGGTLSIDAAAFQFSQYQVPILGGGSGGNKQCTTNTYPEGWNIGVRTSSDGATNTAPIIIHTGMTHDFVTGDVIKIIQVPGNIAANGTWTVTAIDATHFSLNGSDGRASGAYPAFDPQVDPRSIYYSGGGLAFRVNAARGHLCWISDSGAGRPAYWINEKATPIDIRYLGPSIVVGGFDWASGGTPLYDEGDSDVPSAYSIVNILSGSRKRELIKAYYKGNEFKGMFRDVGPDQNGGVSDASNVWGWNRVSPAPNSLGEQMDLFAGQSIPALSIDRIPKPGILSLSARLGSQDTMGWVGIYNANTASVAGLINSWSSDNLRYLGLHSAEFWEGTDAILLAPYQLHGGAGNYAGPYLVTTTSSTPSTPDAVNTCQAQLTAISQPNPRGITGNLCSTITVASITPTSLPTSTPANDTLGGQTIHVGDVLGYEDNGHGVQNLATEFVRVVGISGLSLVVERNPNLGDTGIVTGLQSHASGVELYEFGGFEHRYWNYTVAPHGSSGTDPAQLGLPSSGIFKELAFLSESHIFGHNSLFVNDAAIASGLTPPQTCATTPVYGQPYGIRNYPWPNHAQAPSSAYGCTDGNPAFDGWGGQGFGNYLEKHPSYVDSIVKNPSFFDNRPQNVSVGINGTITKMGTYIFKDVGYWADNSIPRFDQKRQRVHMTSGNHTILDISGPGVMLTDTVSDNFKGCITYVAGECFAGSSVGDAYMNVPNAAYMALGDPDAPGKYGCMYKGLFYYDMGLNDVCIFIQPAYSDVMVQYSISNDPTNAGARPITNVFHMPMQTNLLWETALLPDGDWAMAFSYKYKDSFEPLLFLAKIPPYPGPQRGVNRSSWIPVPIRLANVPAGTDNVVVEFGYNPSFWCNSRHESCVANAASITPTGYNYSISDSYAGLSCSSGCTPVIPALSQRIMWYRVKFRNAANGVIKIGEAQVTATP